MLASVLVLAWCGAATAAPTTGEITGHVTTRTGQPIAGVSVKAQPYLEPAITDATGVYKFTAVPTGIYQVGFDGSEQNYLDQWYFHRPNFPSSDPVRVRAGLTTSGIDATLAPGGIIAGHVKDPAGQPVAGVQVTATAISITASRMAVTDAQGGYVIQALTSSAYMVEFDPGFGTVAYARLAYNQEPDDSAIADFVPVSLGQVTPAIDATLRFPGVLTGRVNFRGNPVMGARVSLLSGPPNPADLQIGPGHTVMTDAEGHYTFTDVFPWSGYRVRFSADGYADQFFRITPTYATAMALTVTERGTVRGIDAGLQLPPEVPVAADAHIVSKGTISRSRLRLTTDCYLVPSCIGHMRVRTRLPASLRHRGSPNLVTISAGPVTLRTGRHRLVLRLSRSGRRVVAHRSGHFEVIVLFRWAPGPVTKRVQVSRR